jgi:hypothetical protein
MTNVIIAFLASAIVGLYGIGFIAILAIRESNRERRMYEKLPEKRDY